jgi:hypothetical protein
MIRLKVILFLLGGFICFIPIKRMPLAALVAGSNLSCHLFSHPQKISYSEENGGYRDIVSYEDQYLAVGTNGRIDCIKKSGEIISIVSPLNIDLNSVIYENKTVIAVGNNGTILVSSDGQTFSKIETGTEKNINSITSLNGILIAAADKGTILISMNGNIWSSIHLPLKGDIVSISANISLCYGVTDKSEIIKSSDGISWDVFNYNEQYAGFNEPCSFKDVLLTGNRIAIIGQHEGRSPVALFSSLGNVWTERSLNYTDDYGRIQMATNLPNDICYDITGDQFFMACENGEILMLPSCTKCNKSFTATEKDLRGIKCTENNLIIVGDDYYVNSISLR